MTLRQKLFPRVPPQPRSPRSAALFAARYAVALGLSTFVFLGGFFRKRNRELVNGILAHFDLRAEAAPALLPAIKLDDLVGTDISIRLLESAATDGNVSLAELVALAKITAAIDARTIFEIGTFDGRTTLNLAANSRGTVFTLDLPPDSVGATGLPLDPSDPNYILKAGSGTRFAGTPEAARITQLFGDSATFDFSPWKGAVDLVFIDGAHSREYVINDTDRALSLMRPQGGVIMWHDYDACFDGVTRALHERAAKGFPLRRIAGTSLAMLVIGEPWASR